MCAFLSKSVLSDLTVSSLELIRRGVSTPQKSANTIHGCLVHFVLFVLEGSQFTMYQPTAGHLLSLKLLARDIPSRLFSSRAPSVSKDRATVLAADEWK